MRDLFDAARERSSPLDPLADRMRPRTFDEWVGQEQVLGTGRLLRQLIESGRIPSIILWGPPGTGKTTLARLIASKTHARFIGLSAVMSGVSDLRAVLQDAYRARGEHRESTILFVDEIHRWSKAQQDALLAAVEQGAVTLIGATTENPSFELTAALLSRTRVFVLEGLQESDLRLLLDRALKDRERGLGAQAVDVAPEALAAITHGAFGDARRALTTLELAAKDAVLIAGSGSERPRITEEIVEEALQHRTLLYDKAGDEHYGVVSAFIKSMRGSDPDAAVYYMARMLEGGENPRFVLRRMVIFASEDIGNADPAALSLAIDAFRAHEFVGMPEAMFALTQTATYLATAPKSNAALTAYAEAKKDVVRYGSLPPPKKLLNAPTPLMRELAHGEGYRYPHDLGGIAEGETYLPEKLVERWYYRPSRNGKEAEIGERLAAIRELVYQARDKKAK